ncbi:MAG TPA: heme-binding protein [Candidatus Binataceae bacterium]|nr:heme-binding protein [Candidatus Binataceae bacterium]
MRAPTYQECVECIGAIFAQAAANKGLPISAAIVDGHGDLVAFGRMDGAAMRTVNLSRDKAYSAIYMSRDTNEFRDMMAHFGFELNWFANPRLTALPGGVRIRDDQVTVGAIGISGRTADEDHELARFGFERLRPKLS